jgi:hypothetical protein
MRSVVEMRARSTACVKGGKCSNNKKRWRKQCALGACNTERGPEGGEVLEKVCRSLWGMKPICSPRPDDSRPAFKPLSTHIGIKGDVFGSALINMTNFRWFMLSNET